jgi:chromate reductase
MKIVGISGSLRKGSFNTMLLNAAAKLTPSGTTIEIASIREIPLYDGDVEAAAYPAAVTGLKEKVIAADGLLLVTPEYNNAMPGVLKNAIDWMTRPTADIPKVFSGKKIGLMGATLGQGGTILSQASWLPVFRTLGTQPWFGGRLQVSGASKVFDAQGNLVDDKVREQLEKYVQGFAAFVASKV